MKSVGTVPSHRPVVARSMSSASSLEVSRSCPTCSRLYSPMANYCAVDGSVLVPSAEDPFVGETVLDRYQIERRLGKGGMGEVFLAYDLRLRRQVAIKYVRGAFFSEVEATARLEREARNAAALDHENLIRVFDLSQWGDDLVLVMEYAAGSTLQEVIRIEAPLHVSVVSAITSQLSDGLTTMHRKGLVHRDLKPSNVILTWTPRRELRAKILDFGIARAFDDPSQSITAKGIAVGTAAYMPPEQLAGIALDLRADVFALAAVAAHMLAGRLHRPDAGRSLSLKHVPRSDSWSDALKACIESGLAPNRKARTRTPREFASQLREAAIELSGSAPGSGRLISSEAFPTVSAENDEVPLTETVVSEDVPTIDDAPSPWPR